MGIIQIELFATLDLVGQAPGGPDEDTDDEFAFGGWQAPLIDDVSGEQIGAAYEHTDALLLGRRTFDVFADYWPRQDPDANPFAALFNRIPKYVASRGTPDLAWDDSHQVGASDLPGDVRALRDRHEHVSVVGSMDLVQTLLREKLFDRLDLWIHPIVLGQGKQVFAGGAVPSNLTLVTPPQASPNGVVCLRYALADGVPATGDMEETLSDR
ncbi:MAG: dihydrofolate reductase family protein [Acidimicrobiales bacterium]|nr:dihydrofolate reductase family protein [Acidimicrobiales bacterium]